MKLSSLKALLLDSHYTPKLVYVVDISSGHYYFVDSIQSDGILELYATTSYSKITFTTSELYSKLSGLDPDLLLYVTLDNSAFPVRALKLTAKEMMLEF